MAASFVVHCQGKTSAEKNGKKDNKDKKDKKDKKEKDKREKSKSKYVGHRIEKKKRKLPTAQARSIKHDQPFQE
jgi:hypothetical protein